MQLSLSLSLCDSYNVVLPEVPGTHIWYLWITGMELFSTRPWWKSNKWCVLSQINKVILTKGWRCLDCTLCEGCGKGSDEARLLLCDSCDISYHTYCLDPPLGHVPQGGWKCKWWVTYKITVCTQHSNLTFIAK